MYTQLKSARVEIIKETVIIFETIFFLSWSGRDLSIFLWITCLINIIIKVRPMPPMPATLAITSITSGLISIKIPFPKSIVKLLKTN
ncbi:hypothetical protein D3C80_1624360 [compost metagenome]